MRNLSTVALAALLLLPTSARSMGELSATPACRSAVEVALSGYAACDMTARSKDSRRPDVGKLAGELEKCRTKFESKFSLALSRNGSGNCTAETSAAFGTYLDGCVVAASEAAGGAALPTPTPTATPTPTPCAVVSNGKGGTYTDNCNGTVTDSTTGLVWEKKTGAVGVHNVDNIYTWSTVGASPWPFDGTAATVFLATLNGAPYEFSPLCFAGFCDWRLPTIEELSGRSSDGYATGGILDLTAPGCGPPNYSAPCINAIFGPTVSSIYWSSSTYQSSPDRAWLVGFDDGYVSGYGAKTGNGFVRAVRSGS